MFFYDPVVLWGFMKRLLVLGLLAFGFTALGLADGHKGNDKGGKGKKDPISMPEGTAFELPYFLLGAASWGLWRWRHPKPLKAALPTNGPNQA